MFEGGFDFQENDHALLPLKQHLQTIHNTHSTMTNLMELLRRTAQHSVDEPAQEDVFCFPLLSTNKAAGARAGVMDTSEPFRAF